MNAVAKIEQALRSGVLIEDLIVVPQSGATDGMIASEEKKLSRSLSSQHKKLLKRWNGMNIDVIRLYGCGPVVDEIDALFNRQSGVLSEQKGNVVFGDDPAGYMYAEADDGSILSVDTASGEVKKLANDIDDFFSRLVFGVDAKDFAGDDWKQELVDSGML
ncbi:MAG: SMI1/KNR4 family protein [Candidatus Thiodiazotropha sp.]